jgi:hypothetical protein
MICSAASLSKALKVYLYFEAAVAFQPGPHPVFAAPTTIVFEKMYTTVVSTV